MVAEGATSAWSLGEELKKRTGFETRVTILGHIQRGGNPSAVDIVLASQMGGKAVETLLAGESEKMIAQVKNEIVALPLETAYGEWKPFNQELYELANQLAI